MRMTKRQWAIVQVLAIATFTVLWSLGIVALGFTFLNPPPPSPTPLAQAVVPSPTPSPSPSATPSPTPLPTSTPTPEPTRTPAPTSTSPPTRTPWPTFAPTPVPAANPAPTAAPERPPLPTIDPNQPTPESVLRIPTAVSPVPVADGTFNIAVLGSDRRPDWSEWHTDAVHVVSIQTNRAAVTVLSIPRDLYVYIPGFWMSRVNFADYYGEAYGYPGGGTALLRDTLLYNLGIRVDHTVRTEFDGLIGIVDSLGGVDIPVHCRLVDHWPYPDENGEYPILTMEPGVQHMDGETALWYARSRLTTSVFSRDRRQQQVLQAIWQKGRDEGALAQIPSLWQQLQSMVVTDMDFDDILNLGRVAFLLQDQNIRFYSINRDVVTPWTTPQGGWVFLPRWEDIQPLVAEAMAPIPEARLNRTFTTVEVWNGTPNQDWDRLAADRLVRAGFPAVLGDPDRRDHAQTELTVFSEYAKGTGVEYLQEMFRVPDERVIFAPDWNAAYGFRLIIGADYRTCYEW